MNFNNDPALLSYSEDEDKDQLWYGRVEARRNELLKAAGVDFWVLVSMPTTTNAKPKGFVGIELKPDNPLPNARISVRVNPTMAKRELKAISRFCDETFEPELLGETRLALSSDPSPNTNLKYRDLTYGPKGKQS